MKSRTAQILTVMNILAWVTLFGLIVKAGSILISYGVSIANPVAAKNLYMGLDLSRVKEFNFWDYTAMVSFLVVILLMEAYIAFLVTRVLTKIKLSNPFTIEVSAILEKISYIILTTWVIVMLYNLHTTWLSKKIAGLRENIISGEFILMAGVVFVFSQIFKRGVEIQSENALTI